MNGEHTDCEVCDLIQQHENKIEQDDKDGIPAHQVSRIVKNENDLLAGLKKTQDLIADAITKFAGSMRFVYIHSVWFAIWIIINIGAIGASAKFDKFPFGLLTLIVSLEAIFLSTFVMLSQNRQGARADVRAELDYETNIRSEVWSLHIGQKLGIEPDHVERAVARLIEQARKDTDQESAD